ncbi:MAG: hypothetical protein WCO57_04775 [Verrucomicrobiota bacterium]
MKHKVIPIFASLLVSGLASAAEGLYNVGSEAQNSIPLKWIVGTDFTYDDNVNPGSSTIKDGATSVDPYVSVSFLNVAPQSTREVYARVGALYYFDKPTAAGSKDFYPEFRAGANLTQLFNERLRFVSRNFAAYELEPDYARGTATTRQSGQYLSLQTDNAIGYRWSERIGTYTGFIINSFSYADVANQDRFTWTLYNQFRFQLNPQRTVLTMDYRYSQTAATGYASDSTDHYILGGIEHRFTPNTILVTRAGAQLHSVTTGKDTTNPFLEMAMSSQVTQNCTMRGFVRYSVEPYDTVQVISGDYYDFSQRKTLRVGISSEYSLTQMFSVFGGLDYIPSTFDGGNKVAAGSGTGPMTANGLAEDMINAYIGLSVKLNNKLYGTLTYNYTDSSSDISYRSYTRSRISLGMRYEF